MLSERLRTRIIRLVRYPKNTKLNNPEAYADQERIFHLTFHAHPEITRLSQTVADAIWEAVLEQRSTTRVGLFAACLMPDHLHLLVSPREQNILTFQQRWKSWSSKLARDAGHFGPVWQPGMWDRVCRDQQDFEATAKYIMRNPVEANLVEDEREWPWTWCWWWWEDEAGGSWPDN